MARSAGSLGKKRCHRLQNSRGTGSPGPGLKGPGTGLGSPTATQTGRREGTATGVDWLLGALRELAHSSQTLCR